MQSLFHEIQALKQAVRTGILGMNFGFDTSDSRLLEKMTANCVNCYSSIALPPTSFGEWTDCGAAGEDDRDGWVRHGGLYHRLRKIRLAGSAVFAHVAGGDSTPLQTALQWCS